jgi:hypothetical protein
MNSRQLLEDYSIPCAQLLSSSSVNGIKESWHGQHFHNDKITSQQQQQYVGGRGMTFITCRPKPSSDVMWSTEGVVA